jgi:hypothetical protein
MYRTFPLNQAKHLIRCYICPKCPLNRTVQPGAAELTPNACETTCTLFRDAAVVAATINSRDTMLLPAGFNSSNAVHRVLVALRRSRGKSPPECFRPQLAALLEYVARHDDALLVA